MKCTLFNATKRRFRVVTMRLFMALFLAFSHAWFLKGHTIPRNVTKTTPDALPPPPLPYPPVEEPCPSLIGLPGIMGATTMVV